MREEGERGGWGRYGEVSGELATGTALPSSCLADFLLRVERSRPFSDSQGIDRGRLGVSRLNGAWKTGAWKGCASGAGVLMAVEREEKGCQDGGGKGRREREKEREGAGACN